MTSGAAACERSSKLKRSTRTHWAPSNRCDAPTQPLPPRCTNRSGAGSSMSICPAVSGATLRGFICPQPAWGVSLSPLLCVSVSLHLFFHLTWVSPCCLWLSCSSYVSLSLSISLLVSSFLSVFIIVFSDFLFSLSFGHCFF